MFFLCLFLSLFAMSKTCKVGHFNSHTFCFLNEILQRLLDVTSVNRRYAYWTYFTKLLTYWTDNRNASKLVQRVPPFNYSIFNIRYKSGRDYRVTPSNFFQHCPFKRFDTLQQTGVSKKPKGPPF